MGGCDWDLLRRIKKGNDLSICGDGVYDLWACIKGGSLSSKPHFLLFARRHEMSQVMVRIAGSVYSKKG